MHANKNLSDSNEDFSITSNVAPGLKVTWVGSVVYVILVVFKLWAGFVSNSQALIADGCAYLDKSRGFRYP